MLIESFQNEKIKNITKLLTDNRFRKKSGVFVVEGQQENERAQKYNFEAVEFFICESIFRGELPKKKYIMFLTRFMRNSIQRKFRRNYRSLQG